MREFSLHKRNAMIDAHRILARRVLDVFLFQVLKPQFTCLVRESAVKGERLTAREINGIALRTKPQIKVYNFQRFNL
jgi:hypothetical protein